MYWLKVRCGGDNGGVVISCCLGRVEGIVDVRSDR